MDRVIYTKEMKWKLPPKIKIYEALGSVSDGRVFLDGNTGIVTSSSGNKSYTVMYDPSVNAIMANDNGSFWQGYLGYPAIAFLMVKGVILYAARDAELLKGIKWKDINTKFKNDWDKTQQYIMDSINQEDRNKLLDAVDTIYEQIKKLELEVLGKKVKPPEGY
jgi:hypothetical protein